MSEIFRKYIWESDSKTIDIDGKMSSKDIFYCGNDDSFNLTGSSLHSYYTKLRFKADKSYFYNASKISDLQNSIHSERSLQKELEKKLVKFSSINFSEKSEYCTDPSKYGTHLLIDAAAPVKLESEFSEYDTEFSNTSWSSQDENFEVRSEKLFIQKSVLSRYVDIISKIVGKSLVLDSSRDVYSSSRKVITWLESCIKELELSKKRERNYKKQISKISKKLFRWSLNLRDSFSKVYRFYFNNLDDEESLTYTFSV